MFFNIGGNWLTPLHTCSFLIKQNTMPCIQLIQESKVNGIINRAEK